MNETFARLHGFDPAAIGLADFGRPEGYVARQVKRWSEQYRASETETIPEMNRLMAWLPEHVPPTARPALVHGDYRLDNLIMHPIAAEGGRRARLGACDARRPERRFRLPPDGLADADREGRRHRHARRARSARLGIPTLEDYAASYARRMGLSEIPHFETLLAYNFFRLAAILQGIVGRVRDGTASNENAAAMAAEVRPLAAAAWDWAVKAGPR